MQNAAFRKSAGETRVATLNTSSLTNFRAFDVAELEWAPGLNILFGPNAAGKTTLLEAVYLLATGRGLRPGRDVEAIRYGANFAEVRGELHHVRAELAVRLAHGVRKTAFTNGVRLPRTADLLGKLPVVCVSSLDMELVRGEPSHRRMFLDLELSQIYPSYLAHLTHYKRSLEHRSSLLRRAQEGFVADCEFEVWEQGIGRHGAALREFRRRFVSAISPLVQEAHASMGSGEEITLEYLCKDDGETAERITHELGVGRAEDIARGHTLIGPHRDDLCILIQNKDAKLYGSQGQQRTAVVALKLATLEYAASLGLRPMLLLDDMLSDLDEGRRSRLVRWVLRREGQAILTCTEPEAAGVELLHKAKVFHVEDGKVMPR